MKAPEMKQYFVRALEAQILADQSAAISASLGESGIKASVAKASVAASSHSGERDSAPRAMPKRETTGTGEAETAVSRKSLADSLSDIVTERFTKKLHQVRGASEEITVGSDI